VSEPSPSPLPYRVVPSARVIGELDALLRRAYAGGHGELALAALREMDYRLRIYPHFGEKLRDLQQTGETLWVATIPPLVVQYVIDEPMRSVFIGTPFKALPNAPFQ
jgi:hypothetical protein